MAWCMQSSYADIPQFPFGVVFWCLGDLATILPANNWNFSVVLQQFNVASGVISMMMGINDRCQLDVSAVCLFLQNWKNFRRIRRINDDCLFGFWVRDDVGVVVSGPFPHGD